MCQTSTMNTFSPKLLQGTRLEGAWYLDDDTIIGDTMVVGKEDPRSKLPGVFPPNITRPLHGARLLGGPASVDFNFSNELVMKRVAKTIVLMDTIMKINDCECELLLLRACVALERIVTAFEPGVPLFFVLKSCSACSKVFTGDIYGDHAISCDEVDIGLGRGCDKPLRLADMLLYSWDKGLDVCGFDMVLTFDDIGYIKKDKNKAKMDKSEHEIGRV
ncbi:hypothetical protein Tco_0748372 [Tanacetum coccineum]|uniref:Uncharacterized protein n=1 Tax=Tanacetum coccineum TaxID=301880 RepID=A0ABQ4YWF2_9ASTR